MVTESAKSMSVASLESTEKYTYREEASQTPIQTSLKPPRSQYKKGKRTDGVKLIFIKKYP